MLNQIDFLKCLKTNLSDMGFGKKRTKELVDEYEALVKGHEQRGRSRTDASLLASDDLLSKLSFVAVEKAKRTANTLEIQAKHMELVEAAVSVETSRLALDGRKGSVGAALGRAAVSTIENDARFGNISYDTLRNTYRGQFISLFDETFGDVSKGVLGRQKGKAHLTNIAREVYGVDTGDAPAAALSKSWLKIAELMVDTFNAAGGSMRKISKYLPQRQSMARLFKAGEEKWVSDHMLHIDWDKTTWPDSTRIDVDYRESFLREIYQTKVTDGTNKLDPKAFRGNGRAIGNALDQGRLLHYKNADSWLAMHDAYTDGNVFETLIGHIESMSHLTAMVKTWGANPEMTAMNLRAMVKSKAAEFSPEEIVRAEGVIKSRFDPMFEVATRKNPLDPYSTTGAVVSATADILTGAQLGAATLLAVPGDFNTTITTRALNNMKLFGGIDTYFKGLLGDPLKDAAKLVGKPLGIFQGVGFQRDIAAQSGFIMDQVLATTYAAQRFTAVTTRAPNIASRVSDAVIRASGLSNHTGMLRWANQQEMMGAFRRMVSLGFEDLPIKHVMGRYGIEAKDWDAFRKNVKPHKRNKRDKGNLRPIDILQSNAADKQVLYNKFQGMVLEESKHMVPDSTIEASVLFKNTTRADTMAGILLQSFAMYKNFPVTFQMKYARLAMTTNTKKGRAGYVAGLIAGATITGALGVQMREITKGRTPLDMTDPRFLPKAMLAGGGTSIFGDFMFTGINEFGRGPEDVFAGPLITFGGDTANLIFGEPFAFMGALTDEDYESRFGTRLNQYVKRYTPGTSIWWSRLVMEREIWDRFEELSDPEIYAKRRSRIKRRETKYGNSYWSEPGDRIITED